MNQHSRELKDEELMFECQKDNIEAFNLLFKRYEKRIYNFSFRLTGNKMSAEDIYLETFMRVYRVRKRYQPTARFSTWIYTIASNLSKDLIKRQSKDQMIYRDDNMLRLSPESPDPPEEYVLKTEHNLKVMKAIKSLTLKQKEVIIMSYYEGLTYPEIASILKCSSSSVKMACHRAYIKLRELLSEYSHGGD